jgi:DNA-dependent RNA polymerase auxiliary subunit epsilon
MKVKNLFEYQLPDKELSNSPQEHLSKLKSKLEKHKKEHEELSKELKHQYTLGPNQLSPQKMDRMVKENNEHIEFINKLTKEIKEFEERNK